MRKTLTKAHSKQLAKLHADREAASAAVYAAAYPRQDVPFSECAKMASAEVRNACDAAWRAITTFELEMVEQGRGWFASFGMFTPY